MQSYCVNDGYFSNIIDGYFKDKSWNKKKCNTKDVTLHHANFSTCSTCDITNGFEDTQELGNKKKLHAKLLRYYKTNNIDRKDIKYLPYTFSFSITDYPKLIPIFDNSSIWIIKPEDGMRQKGIQIIKSYHDLDKAMKINNGKYNDWVCQTYVSNPLLYYNKKFHFRVYALIVRTNKYFSAYLYPRGYMYVADEKFDINDLNNKDQHITSSCNNQEFPSKFNEYYGPMAFELLYKPQFKKILHDTIDATYSALLCPNKSLRNGYKCYKMIAYDIIPDANNTAILMEVNSKVIGMASYDLAGNCKAKKPSLQTPEFKAKLMKNILDVVLRDKDGDFEKVLNKRLRHNDIIENMNIKKKTKTCIYNSNKFYIMLIIVTILILFNWRHKK